MQKKLVIEIAIKFRWILTWAVYEKRLEIALPFNTSFSGELRRIDEKGASIIVSIE